MSYYIFLSVFISFFQFFLFSFSLYFPVLVLNPFLPISLLPVLSFLFFRLSYLISLTFSLFLLEIFFLYFLSGSLRPAIPPSFIFSFLNPFCNSSLTPKSAHYGSNIWHYTRLILITPSLHLCPFKTHHVFLFAFIPFAFPLVVNSFCSSSSTPQSQPVSYLSWLPYASQTSSCSFRLSFKLLSLKVHSTLPIKGLNLKPSP